MSLNHATKLHDSGVQEPTSGGQAIRENQTSYVVYMYTGPLYSELICVIAQSTISMHSMLMLGSLGVCPQENVE